MDDSLAQAAIDFGGRPQLVWNAEYRRDFIGEMPAEMLPHFFKSFCDTAQCNLNIRAEGQNEHHKAEATFKAFARALRMAAARTEAQ
jgi:imidazoleglycerol-phosphate dehydratase/histidinol-phosphatase